MRPIQHLPLIVTWNNNTMSPVPKVIGSRHIVKRSPLSHMISHRIFPFEVSGERCGFSPETCVISNPYLFHHGLTRDTFVTKFLAFLKTIEEFFVAERLIDKTILQLLFETITVRISASNGHHVHYENERQKSGYFSYYVPEINAIL